MIKRPILRCIAIVLLAACAAACTAPGDNTPPPLDSPTDAAPPSAAAVDTLPPDDPLAARVNTAPIYLVVFENEAARRLQALRDHGINLDTPEGQSTVQAVRAQALEALIEDELIAQAAAQLGITISDAEVDAIIQQDINNAGGQAAFDAWLANNGMTLEEQRVAQRTAILNNAVRDHITANAPTQAEQVHARYIQLWSAEEATQVLNMLQAGGDFAVLAQQYSQDPLTSPKGGDLDWFPRGGLMGMIDPALEETAFGLQPGQISGVVTSAFGGQTVYEIVQVLERESARPLSDESLQRLQQQTFLRWLDDLKAKAQIERLVTP